MIRTYRGREEKSMYLEHDPHLQEKRGNIHVTDLQMKNNKKI